MWKLAEIEIEIAGGDCGDGCMNKYGGKKWRSTYDFIEISELYVLGTELLSDIEKEGALKDSTFLIGIMFESCKIFKYMYKEL